jgi:hypothetical protein
MKIVIYYKTDISSKYKNLVSTLKNYKMNFSVETIVDPDQLTMNEKGVNTLPTFILYDNDNDNNELLRHRGDFNLITILDIISIQNKKQK